MEVTELYAFVAEGDGIMAAGLPGLGLCPMVYATKRVAEKFIPLADAIRAESGKPYKLLRFRLEGEVSFQRTSDQ